jgi:formate dehydrogenase major subunit
VDPVRWPALRQLTGRDRLGRGMAVRSPHTEAAGPRTATADRVVASVCPYCAVGCGQQVFVSTIKGRDTVTQIEGDPNSPVSRGRLCPKGAASKQLVTSPGRQTSVLYRRPFATRQASWQDIHDGHRVRRTLGIASLGGATLDNEENYLIKKLWTALGAIQIENQARI